MEGVPGQVPRRWYGGENARAAEILRLAELNAKQAAQIAGAAAKASLAMQERDRLAERVRELEANASHDEEETADLLDRIAALEEVNRRLREANRELTAACTHPEMLVTQEGPLDA